MKYLKLYNSSEEAIMNDGESNIFVINGANGVGVDTPSFLNVEFGFANNTNICSLEFLSGACTNILVDGQHFSKQDLIDRAEDNIISLPSEYLHHNVTVSFQIKKHVMADSDIYDNALHINGTPNSLYSVNLYEHINLLSVSVPKETKEITDMSSCEALTSVTFNDDNIILNEGAFGACASLEEITLPIKIKEIPNELFVNCVSLKHINEFQLKDVETIGEDAFRGCESLGLDLDGFTSLKTISGNAFENCYGLEKWRLPSSLERLPNSGFGANALTEIVLNGTITDLPDRCLSNLNEIEDLYIPDNVQSISIGAFDNDSNLTYIKIDGTPIADDSMYSATTNISVNGHLDCNLETYLTFTPFLPSGWTSNIIYIKEDGTSGLSYYENDIDEDVINVYWPSGVTQIPSNRFSGFVFLSSITIPNSVKSIGQNAFTGCESLSSITLPSGLTSIGRRAFAYTALSSITIPNSVTSITSYVFFECESLSSVTLSSGLTSIGNNTFYTCSALTSIIIPDNVKSIGQNAFVGCESLSSVTLSSKLTSIGNSAFHSCISLSSIIIPNSVTSIDDNAFHTCTSLSSVTLSSGLTSIGRRVFADCASLSSIIIPNSVTSIGESAFMLCQSLSSIIIPNSVTSIGESAFFGCHLLLSVTLSSGLTTIGNSAFGYCYDLHEIIYHGRNIFTIASDAFANVSNTGTLICEDTDAANNILQYLPSGWVVQTS